MPVMYITIIVCYSIVKYITFWWEWQMNRNIYVNVIWHIPVTPELLKLTRKKQTQC